MIACGMAETGIVINHEVAAIIEIAQTSAVLGGIKNGALMPLYAPVLAIGLRVGAIALIDGSVAKIHVDEAKTLFTYCAKIIYQNVNLTDKKKKMLMYVGYKLNIDKSFFGKTCEVMQWFCGKNDAYYR
jgi:hypothetical protein